MTSLQDLLDALGATAIAAYHDLDEAHPELAQPELGTTSRTAIARNLVEQLGQLLDTLADYHSATTSPSPTADDQDDPIPF